MKKFQVKIQLNSDSKFMMHVPAHRNFLRDRINDDTIDFYGVNPETSIMWLLINAKDKESVRKILKEDPLFDHWIDFSIEELIVYDGQMFRLPSLQLN